MRPLLLLLVSVRLFAQGSLDPAKLLQPPTDSWPTYNGDYSGRRYSPLTKINAGNIDSLTLAWVNRSNPAQGQQGAQQGGGGTTSAVIKGTPLVVNGILYYTIPDHVWAVDARTGRDLWHYVWKSKGGWHIGNRGVGVSGNALFFETPE